MFADLHLHTFFSDGTFSPEELARRARVEGLAALALTDHDTVGGCERMAAACAAEGLEFIPGAEFTADHDDREVHILGYWLDTQSPPLLSRLAGFQAVRTNRIRDMVHRLNERGIPLEADTVFSLANCQSPGRPHVARALVAQGYCRNYDDAFDRFLKKGRPGWVPKARMNVATAIEIIHAAGGVAVLAHPGLYRADSIIPELAAVGLDGLECWHTKHSRSSAAAYERLAQELGLVATGGSDCHGMSKGEPLIGSVRIPYAQVLALKERRPTPVRSSVLA
ncbi:MAG TPA: PHP domain-containing protein [Verrucomicrobiota bacterium]|nr:histidinol phosphatase [Verrucomicrobiales bacterium]HRI13488.1 PHP domain-containing protein [Verrucomicrobiota bacterium]